MVGVDENGLGLVESAEEVFTRLEVDAGFAADGRIDHREEGCGDLDEGNAAKVNAGEEASEVAGDTAAEGDDRIVAVEVFGEHLFGESFDCLERFVFFAGREAEYFGGDFCFL